MVTFAELSSDWKKLPNLLTLSRLVLCPIPGILYLSFQDDLVVRIVSFGTFIVIVLTDFLDGYIARRTGQITKLGQVLDPIVDKVLIILTLFLVSIVKPFIMLPALIILLRELSVTLLRQRANARGVSIQAQTSGKIKMVIQTVAVALLLAPDIFYIGSLANACMLAAVAITLVSWYDYHLLYGDSRK